MAAKIQIKFGPAQKGDHPGDTVDYDILARSGKGKWQRVGGAEAIKTLSLDGRYTQPDQYRIGDIQAWLDHDAGADFSVEVGRLQSNRPTRGIYGQYLRGRRPEWTQFATVAEAKRIIKAWAAEQLSAVNWSGEIIYG